MICYIPQCICYGSENFGLDFCTMNVLVLLAQPYSSISFCVSIPLRAMKKMWNLTKKLDHTFQQIYVDDKKMIFNKYICTRKERMNLFTIQIKIFSFL
jgi:uncharacterized phage-like protein YoqJ